MTQIKTFKLKDFFNIPFKNTNYTLFSKKTLVMDNRICKLIFI